MVAITSKCTAELQVYDENGNITYIAPGSNLLKEEFQKQDCKFDGQGNIWRVYDGFNNSMHISQERVVRRFDYVSDSNEGLIEEIVLGKEAASMDSLEYDSFKNSGIYSPEFIAARISAIFG